MRSEKSIKIYSYQVQVIVIQFSKTVSKGILVELVFWTVALLLPCSLELFESGQHTPNGWFPFGGEALLDAIGILVDSLRLAWNANF